MTTKIAILDDYHNVALKLADWSRLPDCQVTAFPDHVDEPAGLIERLRDFDVVCCMRERTAFPRQVFEGLPKLKMLIVTGGRHTRVFDFDAALERGVVICRTGNTRPRADGTPAKGGTAELAIGLMVALTRQVVAEDRNIRKGGWGTTIGVNLQDMTLGLVGLGRLGVEVAKAALFFDMKVIAWSQNLTPERAAGEGVVRVEKDDLFRRADVVCVQMRLSDRTVGLIGPGEFALMKPTAYLINTSRGPIVQEAALIEALKTRRIAGAALDVFDREPLPKDHPFRSLDNTILTPHIGYVLQSKFECYYQDMVEGIAGWLAGKPVRRLKPPAPGESRSTGYWVDE